MGGWKKEGGGKTSRMTPFPKRGFGPLLVRYVFHPLRGQCSFFLVQKSTTKQTRSSFGGVQKFSGERVLWYVFLPPYVLHPPKHSPIDVSRQKLTPHCLATIFDAQLPSPKLSPKIPSKLSLAHKRGPFSSFKITPAVRVTTRQLRDKNCLAAIFAPRHQGVSFGPLGLVELRIFSKMPLHVRAKFKAFIC